MRESRHQRYQGHLVVNQQEGVAVGVAPLAEEVLRENTETNIPKSIIKVKIFNLLYVGSFLWAENYEPAMMFYKFIYS